MRDHNKDAFGLKADPYRVYSALDVALMPLPIIDEKTYAAPLATHSYQKDWVVADNGLMKMQYAPLNYAPRLADNTAWTKSINIVHYFMMGALIGLVAWFLFWGVSYFAFKRRFIPTKSIVSRTIFIGGIVFCISIGGILNISHHYHVMGTNKIGQDVFYIAIKSIRTGVMMGSLTTLLMLPLALIAAIPAGYWGGWIDDIIQFIYITLSSIPGVLLIAASILAMQIYVTNHPDIFTTATATADARLLTLCAILGVTSWTTLCRVIRAETLKLREADFVLASKAMGHRSVSIMLRHILPNVSHLVLISTVLDFSGLVMAEAILTYIGVGVDPNMYSWGNMIAAARLELAREPVVWWPLMAAFVLMFIFILAINLFADGVRKGFSPRE